MVKAELEQLVGKDEKILWSGAPKRSAYLWRSFVNLLLPIALLWCCIDIPLFIATVVNPEAGEEGPGVFLIPFLLLHMTPVWLYLFTAFFSFARLKNTGYIITDKSVYVSGGVFALNTQVKPLAKLSTVTISRGLIDRRCKVGSVVLNDDTTTNGGSVNRYSANSQTLLFLPDYEEVFALIRDEQENAYARAHGANEPF